MKPVRRTPLLDPEAGKLPPQAPEMEQAVLGAILIHPKALSEVSDFLAAEHFYVEAHGVIYRAVTDLNAGNKPIDVLTVTMRLKERGELDIVGGPFYLSQLTNKVGSSANIEFHARIVAQQFMRRKLIQTCAESLSAAYDDTCDVFELMDQHNRGMAEINSITDTSDPVTVAAVMDAMVENREKPLYLHFGLGELDNHVAMGPGCITVIGARPAVGKTTLIMNGLMNIARAGHRCLFISLEMNDKQLTAKVSSALTGINSERVTRDEVNEEERGRIALAASENGAWTPRILIDDRANLKASQVSGLLERAVKRHGCKLAVIDYLQLMDGEGEGGHAIMSNISKSCKQAAKASGIRLVELSQLKRRDGNEVNPNMDDLRESGQIEADADIIMLLGREKGGSELLVNVAKNKIGPIGSVRLPFDLMTQRIGGVPQFQPRDINPNRHIEPKSNPDEPAPF